MSWNNKEEINNMMLGYHANEIYFHYTVCVYNIILIYNIKHFCSDVDKHMTVQKQPNNNGLVYCYNKGT